MSYHVPVMLSECMDALVQNTQGIYVDCTLGGGGHSERILQLIDPLGKLFSIDQDDEAIAFASKRLQAFPNLQICKGNFSEIAELTALPENSVDGILMDLGVSSHQLDADYRGFSFQGNAALDMRMNSGLEFSAYDVVNSYDQSELTRIFFRYGEEKNSKKIAQAIAHQRMTKTFETTDDLKQCILAVIPQKFATKSLARIFQAIRIEVNKELDVLETALEKSFQLLKDGGRLVVMSYHSLEDRIVKQFIQAKEKGENFHDLPIPIMNTGNRFKKVTRKPVLSTEKETEQNPRARSAKLRVAEKVLG